jgi:hypothetical protein
LLEDRLVLAGDVRVARLPLDLVERVAARNREVTANAEARRLFYDGVLDVLDVQLGSLDLVRARHAAALPEG